MKTCSTCPHPAKCRAAGKCLKQAKSPKTMGIFNTSNNYSNMGKTYGAQGAQFRSNLAKALRKGGNNPENQSNYP